MKSILVCSLLSVVFVTSLLDRTAAVKCYTCQNRPGGNDLRDNGCGTLTVKAKQNQTDNCTTCSMSTIMSPDGTRPVSIDRACERDIYTMACRNNITQNASHCYCATDLCNDLPIYYVGTLSCYACDSADFINNGCGETVISTSLYVTHVHGCVACNTYIMKTTTGVIRYRRSCLHDVDPLLAAVRCTVVNSTSSWPCENRCTTNYCNHAASLRLSPNLVTALVTALVLSLVLKHRNERV